MQQEQQQPQAQPQPQPQLQRNRYKRRSVDLESLRREQESKTMRRRMFYVVLFLLLLVAFTAICFIFIFKIKTVRIEGLTRYSHEEIMAAFGVAEGENLYSFDTGERERAVQSELPYLSEVNISRDLPFTVVIEVKEKQPDMYVEIKGDTYLLTDSMQILEYTDDAAKLYGLLRVELQPEIVSRCIVGEKLKFRDGRTDAVIAQAFADISAAGLDGRINYINANNRFDIRLGIDGKYSLYMGDINEFDTKLSFALGIMSKLGTMSGTPSTGKIDVSEINKGVFIPD